MMVSFCVVGRLCRDPRRFFMLAPPALLPEDERSLTYNKIRQLMVALYIGFSRRQDRSWRIFATLEGPLSKQEYADTGCRWIWKEGQRKREGPEKALPRPVLIFARRSRVTSPPLPARRPNCSTSPCVTPAPAPGENQRGIECADPSRSAPIANPIVNLTLTTQSLRKRPLRHGRCKAPLAQQSGECACVKAGQNCPSEPFAGRPRYETSVKPRVFRLLGREA